MPPSVCCAWTADEMRRTAQMAGWSFARLNMARLLYTSSYAIGDLKPLSPIFQAEFIRDLKYDAPMYAKFHSRGRATITECSSERDKVFLFAPNICSGIPCRIRRERIHG